MQDNSIDNTVSSPSLSIGMVLPALHVTDLTIDGGAIARYDGRVVFLDDGIPGAVVEAKLTKITKNILHAEVVHHIKPSADEVAPWCPFFGPCGGCAWQHISLPAQRAWKEKRVVDTLTRIGGITTAVHSICSGEQQNFRTRMTYAFGEVDGRSVVGLRHKKTQQVVPVHECGLQREASPVLQATQAFLDSHPELSAWTDKKGYFRFLRVHTPLFHGESTHAQCVAEFIVNKAPDENNETLRTFAATLLEQGIVTGVLIGQRKARSSLAFSETILHRIGETDIEEQYGDIPPFVFSPESFMQTNTNVFSALLERVFALVPHTAYTAIWDLYCGSGVIGQYLVTRNGSMGSTRLFGVDNSSGAIAYAKKNAASQDIVNAVYTTAPLKKALAHAPFSPEMVILDPPRGGVEENVLSLVEKSGAQYILYISCDVATQARDIKRLGEGWQVQGAFPFDMFPETPHIENVVLLIRN